MPEQEYRRPRRRPAVAAAVTACLVLPLLAAGGYLLLRPHGGEATFVQPVVDGSASPDTAPAPDASDGALRFERLTGPARTLVRDSRGNPVATFTDGARTVLLSGAKRVFAEPTNTPVTVTSTAWVRLAPTEWRADQESADWVRPWLAQALADTGPDVLAVALEYLTGTPERKDGKGVRYAGDASFGPLSETDPDGRAENSDFYDYLGVAWSFGDTGRERPDPGRFGAVDCSGYLRLVYGYRMGYPLRNTNTKGAGLPRRAFAMSEFGPGVEVIANRGAPPSRYDPLQPGDLVFFHSDPGTPAARADHSGIYLGVDGAGHHRFVSSRSRANGPTFGDTGGAAILDGGGYWSQRLRNARRI
jgi:cell wall-associated NlpC family hydrolase